MGLWPKRRRKIYRLGKRISFGKRGFLWCPVILAAVLCAPHVGGETPNIANGTYNAAAVMIIFPFIVAAGAGSPLLGEKTAHACANSWAKNPTRST